uniref:Uncharacterized protein n=1 Tax=Anguilla anguilla TaxID=7936 RepID=A0A0E9RFJ8_ANGAN
MLRTASLIEGQRCIRIEIHITITHLLLIYCKLQIANSNGPRMEPCGTPLFISRKLDCIPPATVACFLPDK